MAVAAAATSEEAGDGRTLAYVGLGLATGCWAAAFIVGKVVLAQMTPLPAAIWRYAVAVTMLLPFAVRQRPRAGLGAAAAPLAAMVVLGGVCYPWLFFQALARTSATNTSLLIALNPVLTVLLTPLVGERLDRRCAVGIALALAGAVTVITRGHAGALVSLGFETGDLLALAAAAAWACFNIASRGVVDHLSPAFTNCVVYTLGGIALFALGRADAPVAQLAAATPATLAGIVAMALFSSVLAGQFFLFGVRTVGVARTVVFVYVVPVLTALLATVLLGERFEAAQAAGGAAVLAGVWWTSRS
jgi:drug/metabolite transporter (DMT)-like permease